MVTKRLAKYGHGEHCKTSFLRRGGGKAEQDLGALGLEDWYTHTQTHPSTCVSSWKWPPVDGGGRQAWDGLPVMYAFWIWLKRWHWQTTALNTGATWPLQSRWTGDNYAILPPGPLYPGVSSRQGEQRAWSSLRHPGHHPPPAPGTTVLQRYFSGTCCVRQKRVEFHPGRPGLGRWLGCPRGGHPCWLCAGVWASPSLPDGSAMARQTLRLCLPAISVPPRLSVICKSMWGALLKASYRQVDWLLDWFTNR